MTVETSMTVAAFGHVINGTCESPAGRLSVLVDPVTDNVYARAAVGSADDVDRAVVDIWHYRAKISKNPDPLIAM